MKKRVFVFTLLIMFLLNGCAVINTTAPTTDSNSSAEFQDQPGRQLRISLTVDENVKTAKYSCKELGGNFTEGLNYVSVTDVNIEIDGDAMPLVDALSQNLLNEEDIFYYARADARNGVCEEIYESEFGLTHFTYCYPEYNLRLIYAMYETPDGQPHLISDIAFYPPDFVPPTYTTFYNEEIINYDLEDWGINFAVITATPTSITFSVTQSGGQQIGQLMLDGYGIFTDSDTAVEKLDGTAVMEPFSAEITMNGTTEITIDWSKVYAPLPSGHYILNLGVRDVYEESALHPLMRNYYDYQLFNIENFIVE